MSCVRAFAAIGLALCVTNCAIRPLPEQVTGVGTDDIVKRIRCETRDAIRLKAKAFLDYYLLQNPQDKAALELDESLSAEEFVFDEKKYQRLKGYPRSKFDEFSQSAIAYNFTFDMTEINNLDPGWDGIGGIPRGTFTLGVTAGFDRTRHSIRTFTVADTFGQLVRLNPEACKNNIMQGPNYIYPIVGTIGIKEMIDNFIDLKNFDNLAKNDKGITATSDSIEFQTNLSLGITPSVVLTPLTKGFVTKDAMFGITNKRQDSHKVIVGLSLDTKAKAPTNAPQLISRPSNPSPAEQGALSAIDQHILRFEIGQRATLIPIP